MTLNEKASYIKGFIEGLEFPKDSKEFKVFSCISEFLEDISTSVSNLEDEVDELFDEVDEINSDLDCNNDCKDKKFNSNSIVYKVTCPICREDVSIPKNSLTNGNEADCPNCGQKLQLDISTSLNSNCDYGCDSDCDCHSLDDFQEN